MSNTQPSAHPGALQLARAAHLRDLFEPWSVRRLEARTGIGRGTLQTRFNGTTALTMSDIEILAPVIRMTPTELFAELLTVEPDNDEAPTREGEGQKLPHLDSNQEPIGSRPVASITDRIAARATPPVDRDRDATITRIGA